MKNPAYGVSVVKWVAPEFLEVHRGTTWKIGAAVLTTLLIMYAIWQGTYSFVVVLVLLAGIYFLFITSAPKPKTIEIALTTRGIHAGKQFISYSEMEAFWIFYRPDQNLKTLNVLLKSGFVREFSYQLADQDPNEVHDYMSSHVYELEGREETFIEKTTRILKL